MQTMLFTVFPLHVRKILESGYLLHCIQAFNICQKPYAKAMQSLATIKHTLAFKYITKESFNILYKTYIQPHIEYCVQAWSPYYAKDIDLLEKVQHRAAPISQLTLPTCNASKDLKCIPFTAGGNVEI